MEIIAHTASKKKIKETLVELNNNSIYNKIELDFIPTKDNIFVWSHDNIYNKKIINRCNYKDLTNLLSLDDVLGILNKDKPLIIEIKFARDIYNNIDNYLHALESLKSYNNQVSICSFNEHLMQELLQYKSVLENIKFGIIVNLFKTFKYNSVNSSKFKDIDFISIASELYEFSLLKNELSKYKKLFPNAKKYAWVWDLICKENKKRIGNFIDKNVDGIFTTKPELVNSLIKKSL